MKTVFTVHSVAPCKVAVAAKTADGRDVVAKVPGLVVEVVSADESHGHTHRFAPATADDMAALKALFVPGGKGVECEEAAPAEAAQPAA